MFAPRAELDVPRLERYAELAAAPVVAAARIAVAGAGLPDLAPATERVLNRALEAAGAELRFVVAPECTPDCEVCVTATLGDSDVLGLDSGSTRLAIEYSRETLAGGRVPEIVEYLVLEHVYREEIAREAAARTHDAALAADSDAVTVAYSPEYHVTLSLLGEGGAPLVWDVAAAVDEWLGPLLGALRARVANITLDSQLGFYAEPGCERTPLLTRANLATFVNFAEWSLASSMPYPTLNFVLYVPTAPLAIEDSPTNSFLVPQWGGVVIAEPEPAGRRFAAEDLRPPLETFAKQLLALLGMRESPDVPLPSRAPLDVRIAALSRSVMRRGLRGAAASLGSLHRLTAKMPHIAIPQKVADSARAAERAIDAALAAARRGDSASAVRHASAAHVSADRAFFDKHMVAQSYIPDEHKLAVYMPLIGPLFVVVMSGWTRLYREFKASRLAPSVKASNAAKVKAE